MQDCGAQLMHNGNTYCAGVLNFILAHGQVFPICLYGYAAVLMVVADMGANGDL
jgi:hypothetical protein